MNFHFFIYDILLKPQKFRCFNQGFIFVLIQSKVKIIFLKQL